MAMVNDFVHVDKEAEHTEVRMRVPSDLAAAIGDRDLADISKWSCSTMFALAWCRMDDKHGSANWSYRVGLAHQLAEHVTAIRDAAIVRDATEGGSVDGLSTVLDMPRSSAGRVRKLAHEEHEDPTGLAKWAVHPVDAAEPPSDSPEWRGYWATRLKRALDEKDAGLLAEVTQRCDEAGILPSVLLDPDEADPEAESSLFHEVIVLMLSRQDKLPNKAEQALYRSITDRVERAKAVVKLYSRLETGWMSRTGEDNTKAIFEAYDLAARIVNAHKRTES